MRKRFLCIMLSAVLLFSSCEKEIPTETTTIPTETSTDETTEETTTAPSETTTVTTTEKTTTTTVTTVTEEAEDYKKDWIKPTVLDEKISFTAENHVYEEKIFYELWESFDFDFTQSGDMYEMAKGYDVSEYEKYPAEKNTALGHQHLNQWLTFYYTGTAEADWLCVANYVAEGFSPGGVYTRIVLVKNNEIVREVCGAEMNLASLKFLHGDIFVQEYFSLHKLNLETGELKTITRLGYNSILCTDEKYIVFGGMRSEDWKEIVIVYNRETEAVTETDIVIYDSYIRTPCRINGDTIEYFDFNDNKAKICDIRTGKSHADENLYFYEGVENDEYIFSCVEDPKAGASHANGVKITRKSDGKTKIFDISIPLGSEPVMRGDWCVFTDGYPARLITVNFETEEICKGEFEGIYNIDYCPVSDKFYVHDHEEKYTIELRLPAEKIKPVILEEKLSYTEKYSVDIEVEKQLWKLCDYDYTKDESTYPIAAKQEFICNEFPEIANTTLGHQYLYMNLDYTFLGTEEADWICIARYMNDVAIPSFIYSEIVLVKDNTVVRQVWETEGPSPVGIHVSCGEVFMVTYGGIYSLDIETGEAVMLMGENYGAVVHIDENYIVYGESNIRIYDRRTGEVTETGINYSTYASPSYTLRFNDNKLEYMDKDTEKNMVYDIATGEIYEAESVELCEVAENGNYMVRPVQKGSDDRYTEIIITRKSDGLAKKYDVSEIAAALGAENNKLSFMSNGVLFSGDYILIHGEYQNWYALNFETDESAIGDIGFSSNLIYSPDHDLYYKSDREVVGVIEPVFPF